MNIRPAIGAAAAQPPAEPNGDDESAPSPDYQKALEDLEPGSPASSPDPDLDLDPIPDRSGTAQKFGAS